MQTKCTRNHRKNLRKYYSTVTSSINLAKYLVFGQHSPAMVSRKFMTEKQNAKATTKYDPYQVTRHTLQWQ